MQNRTPSRPGKAAAAEITSPLLLLPTLASKPHTERSPAPNSSGLSAVPLDFPAGRP